MLGFSLGYIQEKSSVFVRAEDKKPLKEYILPEGGFRILENDFKLSKIDFSS